jgi:UDPglucose 6-dehydrogenase
MRIAILGTGYVGLVSGACFADFGHHVTCVDTNPLRVEQLQRGEIPFFEPGLSELVSRNVAAGRLEFATEPADAVRKALVVILAVGTPETVHGEADLSQVMAAARDVGRNLLDYKVIVTKSTVPAGTGVRLEDEIRRNLPAPVDFDVVSNPEFLREGSAVGDFTHPDRVVIGASSERAAELMRELYRPLYLIETPVVQTDVATAEMIKYASNAFLAVKISFINEIANLCERVGADVHRVAKGMGLDRRIGPKFLHAGPGFGGSCFPKDTRALAAMGTRFGAPQRIVESAIKVNERQRELIVEKLHHGLGTLIGRQIAVLGLSFKPNTSDVRESPGLYLCRRLLSVGAAVRAFDPVANREAAATLDDAGSVVRFADSVQDAVRGAHAMAIMTEWNEFRSLDLARLRPLMRQHVLVDARNILDPAAARKAGFEYFGTGRTRSIEGLTV